LYKRLLFIVSEDWYFVSHRLHLAVSAINAGYSVALLSHYTKHQEKIKLAGVETINWQLNRGSKNLIKEIISIKGVVTTIRQFQPSLIHSVAIKPVLYSGIACKMIGLRNRVFALAGLGFIFTSDKRSAKYLRPIIKYSFKFLFKGDKTRLIVQNPEDQAALSTANIINENNISLIRGSGVNMNLYSFSKIPEGTPIIMLPARMLWDKGIGEFVKVAKILKQSGIKARFVLVGSPDVHNPETINDFQLKNWENDQIIEWWGQKEDMAKMYYQSTIVCLPSYREGLPKSLLEAASCGRPIVTYDVPGCREIVKDGYNGYLVQLKSINGLVQAISQLLNDHKLCVQMGKNGRKLVKKHFSQEQIANETLAVWEEVLS